MGVLDCILFVYHFSWLLMSVLHLPCYVLGFKQGFESASLLFLRFYISGDERICAVRSSTSGYTPYSSNAKGQYFFPLLNLT